MFKIVLYLERSLRLRLSVQWPERVLHLQDSLVRLMYDLKEEGNALFKEGHYDIAWMHYRNAIFVVRNLENRYYHKIEKDFVSSLFSNRAFCCLKKVRS